MDQGAGRPDGPETIAGPESHRCAWHRVSRASIQAPQPVEW